MAPPKGKAGMASIGALKSMMAAKQAAEAEAKRIEEEERARIEEEERRAEAILKEKEEAERAVREAERLHREEMRRSGKLLTKSEQERADRNKLKLDQLLAASTVHIAALAEGTASPAESGSSGQKAKRPVYEKKKKAASGAGARAAEQAAGPAEEKAAEDDVLDDWENALGSDDESDDGSDNGSEEGEPLPVASLAAVASRPPSGAAAVEAVTAKVQSTSISAPPPGQAGATAPAKKGKGAAALDKELRSPICCILGHVDTGKTKLLDKIRQTNVQEGEAGGITQQIGATYFPIETIKEKTLHLHQTSGTREQDEAENASAGLCRQWKDFAFRVPGLLIIDTPGHESFTNLRSRGSSLCNIAILVVDIMHGLEPQTIESIGLLRSRKTPFIVALNKIDRLYGWKSFPGVSLKAAIEMQGSSVRKEFSDRLAKTIVAFAEQGLNAELFYKNEDVRRSISLVPTSAITGDGIPDMLMLLIDLTQTMMSERLMYLSTLQCTVLEVKVIEGLGTTIDVILSNGVLREGDRIAVCGLNGPISTTIRALLTPQPLRELRIKSNYIHHKEVKASLGVKISAPDLDKALPGSPLYVIGPDDDEEEMMRLAMADLTDMLESVDTGGSGVCVQASTLGSLEALLAFLKTSKIPVSAINIGPIHKKDVLRASVMLETAKEFAVILAFDVKVDKEIQDFADEMDVRIFKADIIYHLFDQFTAYMNVLIEQKRKDMAPQAVFPCILRIVPGCVFNKCSPIILGVEVVDGVLRQGTPLCVPSQGNMTIGRVTSIEANHKPLTEVRKGFSAGVAIKIEHASYEASRSVGRHFFEKDELASKISRTSIDVLKENFRNDMTKDDWQLIVRLKKMLNIQ